MRAKIVALIGAVALTAGCATAVDRGADRLAERAGDAVHDYCDGTTEADREAVRTRVNDHADPYRVEIDCDD